jgi:hypothetical protein
MELEYTYFEGDDGFFVGWFDDFPDDVTHGKSLEKLEEMLADLYQCLNLAKYLLTKSIATHKTPTEIISEMVRKRIAAAV